MLANTDMKQKLSKKEYKEIIKELEVTMTRLQQEIMIAKVPVVIVFEGWGASGKGTFISRVVNPLDPRYFDVRTTGKITEEKLLRPFLWSFWTYLPPQGQIVIMDKSWHRIILPGIRDAWDITDSVSHGFYYDVNAFERQLTDDGTLIIKLFTHISKSEQRRRLKELEKSLATAWRVSSHDWEQNKNYEQNLRTFDKMLRMTGTDANPWHIIESDNMRFATVKILKTIINAIEKRISNNSSAAASYATILPPKTHTRILKDIQPDKTMEDKLYKEQLSDLQDHIHRLDGEMFAKRRSAVIVYEGWDAAGKGGNIKRLTDKMDPRSYTVVPTGAPRPQELARHYLWRFMVKIPKDGHLTIFDRSWYGRVLVERVENLTPEHIWQRAYWEINEMEQHLINHGVVILKFWMHIDRDEQLRRFNEREENPLKQHKITEEDWRNREKWDAYELAADEMLSRTHKPQAPWIIVESNNKKFARVKVLQTVVDALDEAMH